MKISPPRGYLRSLMPIELLFEKTTTSQKVCALVVLSQWLGIGDIVTTPFLETSEMEIYNYMAFTTWEHLVIVVLAVSFNYRKTLVSVLSVVFTVSALFACVGLYLYGDYQLLNYIDFYILIFKLILCIWMLTRLIMNERLEDELAAYILLFSITVLFVLFTFDSISLAIDFFGITTRITFYVYDILLVGGAIWLLKILRD